MITFKEISMKALRKLVLASYRRDRLLPRVHERAGTLEQMVDSTMASIRRAKRFGVSLLGAYYKGAPVAYAVVLKANTPILYSFGVDMRRRKFAKLWLDALTRIFDGRLLIGINTFNKRAIEFFKRNSYREHQTIEH